MSSLAQSMILPMTAAPSQTETSAFIPLNDYIPFIRQAMTDRHLSIRKLARLTGIRRDRLSGLLKTEEDARGSRVSYAEFQIILATLGIDFLQAVRDANALRDLSRLHDERFSSAMQMLGEVTSTLPLHLANALNEIEGMDGTEVRREWAEPVRDGVVDLIVRNVVKTIERRISLGTTFRFE